MASFVFLKTWRGEWTFALKFKKDLFRAYFAISGTAGNTTFCSPKVSRDVTPSGTWFRTRYQFIMIKERKEEDDESPAPGRIQTLDLSYFCSQCVCSTAVLQLLTISFALKVERSLWAPVFPLFHYKMQRALFNFLLCSSSLKIYSSLWAIAPSTSALPWGLELMVE